MQTNTEGYFVFPDLLAGTYSRLRRPAYRYNLAGWNLGGLVWPKNRKNASLFFFVSQEYMQQKTNYDPQSVRMPTELERQGDFSQSLDTNRRMITVYDPLTAAPFPGNRRHWASTCRSGGRT